MAARVVRAHRAVAGTGKRLLRELTACDEEHGTGHARALLAGVRDPDGLVAEVDGILDVYGGRLFAGFELSA